MWRINFRNPIEFINQWQYWQLRYKIRGIIIWLFYAWGDLPFGSCGVRIFGIEIYFIDYL